jgi:hypothetical protein
MTKPVPILIDLQFFIPDMPLTSSLPQATQEYLKGNITKPDLYAQSTAFFDQLERFEATLSDNPANKLWKDIWDIIPPPRARSFGDWAPPEEYRPTHFYSGNLRALTSDRAFWNQVWATLPFHRDNDQAAHVLFRSGFSSSPGGQWYDDLGFDCHLLCTENLLDVLKTLTP